MKVTFPLELNTFEKMREHDDLLIAILDTDSDYNLKLNFVERKRFMSNTSLTPAEGAQIPKYRIGDEKIDDYYSGIIAVCINPKRYHSIKEMINDTLYMMR